MLIQAITITKNLPQYIISCINSIINQTYSNFTYDLYIVTELDSEELLYTDLLEEFIGDSRLNVHFVSSMPSYSNFEKNYNSLYLEVNPNFVYKKNFFEHIVKDFTNTNNSIIHYLPRFYISEKTIYKNTKSNISCTVINKAIETEKSDIKHTSCIIGQDLAVDNNADMCHIDNKYCSIYWFNHPKWQSYIYLNKRNNRVYHINNNDHGKYENIDDYKIKIIWDNYESEIFQRIDNVKSIIYNA